MNRFRRALCWKRKAAREPFSGFRRLFNGLMFDMVTTSVLFKCFRSPKIRIVAKRLTFELSDSSNNFLSLSVCRRMLDANDPDQIKILKSSPIN